MKPRRSRRRTVSRRMGGGVVATRRPRVPRALTIVVGVIICVLAYLGVAAAGQADPAAEIARRPAQPAAAASAPDTPRRDADRADRARRQMIDTAVFASVDGLDLHLPHPRPLAVAFHEATRPEALGLDPRGRLESNDNATKFVAAEDTSGPDYRILSSRGRARPATSAVDVVVEDGDHVTAVVTGTVVEVRQYVLYGSLRDWRVVIEPAERPDLHVVMIHLHEPAVEVGDAVVAGETPLAVARLLPFDSHVDYVVGKRYPHVHLEVKAATPARPLDPNEPAVDPVQHLEAHTDRLSG